jgi:hypothetical protein
MSLVRSILPLLCFAAVACSPAAAPSGDAPQAAAAATVNCESPAAPLAIGAQTHGDIPAAQNYPDNARYFCINVPADTASLTLELSGMATDLDLYVGHGTLSSVQGVNLQNGDTYEWKSNEFGNNPERVTIDHPTAGVYYAEIVSYQGVASGFDFSAR